MNYAYCGKFLDVDLTAGSCRTVPAEELFFRTYLGGPGTALRLLLDAGAPEADPLGPGNTLIFSTGLLTGTGCPCVPRYTVCARSPLTGAVAKSEAGGWWGPELKGAGYDGVIVRGRSAAPVYLWVSSKGAEIRPATGLWGLDTGEASEAILRETGDDKTRIALIGPGGENMVRFANICNELVHFNGRNGLGAVMGSKNLKALAVRGGTAVSTADPTAVQEALRWVGREFRNHPQSRGLHDMGTAVGVEVFNAAGALPTRNWNSAHFDAAERIGGDRLNEELLVQRGGCHRCPINCKRVVEVKQPGLQVDRRYGGPEYETLAALGANCGISNLHLIAKANELCNRYTIDTISAGMTISWAMDCFERGIIQREDTGGLDLSFGNEAVLLPLLEQIARREGFGAILSDGSVMAARRWGREAEARLLQVKGQELPMHDPRIKTGLGLQFAVSPHGADHWFAQHDAVFTDPEAPGFKAVAPLGLLKPLGAEELGPEKVRLFYYTSLITAMYDCLGACVFGMASRSLIPLHRSVEMVRAAAGWDTSLWELMKTGERSIMLARIFNRRAGFSRRDDVLPPLFFQPLSGGPLDGKNALDSDEFDHALELYYEMAGIDPSTGFPKPAKLYELGLDFLDG